MAKFRVSDLAVLVSSATLRGSSLHAAARCAAGESQALEHLCHYIELPTLANGRAQCSAVGQVLLKLRTP